MNDTGPVHSKIYGLVGEMRSLSINNDNRGRAVREGNERAVDVPRRWTFSPVEGIRGHVMKEGDFRWELEGQGMFG